jgi:hypothetical protein
MAEMLGISRSAAYRLAQEHGLMVKVSDERILAAWAESRGDVVKAADSVRLPEHHFKQRLTASQRARVGRT